MTQKHKIQLFEEKKVRTVWDDQQEKWYFSIVDVCWVLADSKDYQTARKYWNKLKQRLKEEGNETVTNCHQLKLKAWDGKIRQRENREEEQRQNERLKKMDKAMRAIEVVGQIIKNRRNSLEKSKLLEMVVELYYAGFRTVNDLGSTLAQDKKALVEDIIKDEELGGDTMKIRDHINYFFEITTFRFCLFVFSKIINSVGVKELRWLYNEASAQIDTPAADVVTFSIESVYSTLAVDDLKKLVANIKTTPLQ